MASAKIHTETKPVTKMRYQPKMPKKEGSQRDLKTNNHSEEEGSQRRDTWRSPYDKRFFTAFAYFTRILSLRQCPYVKDITAFQEKRAFCVIQKGS